MNCVEDWNSPSATRPHNRLLANTRATLRIATIAPVRITVEMAGLAPCLPEQNFCNLNSTTHIFLLVFCPPYRIMGTTFDATIAMSTSKAECLNPAASDSSLILPATSPIR